MRMPPISEVGDRTDKARLIPTEILRTKLLRLLSYSTFLVVETKQSLCRSQTVATHQCNLQKAGPPSRKCRTLSGLVLTVTLPPTSKTDWGFGFRVQGPGFGAERTSISIVVYC